MLFKLINKYFAFFHKKRTTENCDSFTYLYIVEFWF